MCLYVCLSVSSGQYLSAADSRSGSLWSGELSRNAAPGFGYSEKQVTISMDSGSAVADVRPVKQVPVWLSHSTVTDTATLLDRQQQLQQLLQVTTTRAAVCDWPAGLSVC